LNYKPDILGRLLFGRALRLNVALWILGHESESFYQGEAAEGVDYSAGAVAHELDRLAELGMLMKEPRNANDRRQYYLRLDTPLWEIVEAAQRALATGYRAPKKRR
jgi:DNA-binding MarR family transcriptional regulator